MYFPQFHPTGESSSIVLSGGATENVGTAFKTDEWCNHKGTTNFYEPRLKKHSFPSAPIYMEIKNKHLFNLFLVQK